MKVRPIARAINKPLLVFGLPRRLFGVVGMGCCISYEVIAAFIHGLAAAILPAIAFCVLYYVCKKLYRKDDQILEVWLCSALMETAYDPFKRDIFTIEIIEIPEED